VCLAQNYIKHLQSVFGNDTNQKIIIKFRKFMLQLCYCNWLTKPLEQSPSWEANSRSASQEISFPLHLWSQKIHYRVHKSPSLFPILCQIYPLHNFSSYFPKIQSDILPSTPRSSKLTFSLQVFQPEPCMCLLSMPCVLHVPSISSSIWSFQ